MRLNVYALNTYYNRKHVVDGRDIGCIMGVYPSTINLSLGCNVTNSIHMLDYKPIKLIGAFNQPTTSYPNAVR